MALTRCSAALPVCLGTIPKHLNEEVTAMSTLWKATIVVWLAALGSAAGVAYALDRPLEVRALPDAGTLETPACVSPAPATVADSTAEPGAIFMPEDVIRRASDSKRRRAA
jgi:hypothetical protein